MTNPSKSIVRILVGVSALAGIVVFWLAHRQTSGTLQKVSLRLEWYPQAQFCGYIAAKELGYYSQDGINIDLRPAGPDLKPQLTVAGGSDDIGIGVSNQVVAAESNGVPLKIIAQMFQDSANRYILKSQNAIKSLRDLEGKKVGLWLGGDEAEFVAMLKTKGMTLKDVQVVPEGFSVIPFLQDQYVLSEVTVYNELPEIASSGYPASKLQILSPSTFNSAIVGDMIFTREAFIQQHLALVRQFLDASMRGWQYCLAQPRAAIDLVLKENPSLDRGQQLAQLQVISGLISSGGAASHGLGYMDPQYYSTTSQVLLDSGQIVTSVNPQSVFDATAWQALSAAVKSIPSADN